MADLLGLDLTLGASVPPAADNSVAANGGGASLLELFGGAPVESAPGAATSAVALGDAFSAAGDGELKSGGPIDVALRVLTAKDDGVLYEDAAIQLGVKSTFADGRGQVTLYHGNKSDVPLAPFSCTLLPGSPVTVEQPGTSPTQLAPKAQTQQPLAGIVATGPFSDAPLLSIKYTLVVLY